MIKITLLSVRVCMNLLKIIFGLSIRVIIQYNIYMQVLFYITKCNLVGSILYTYTYHKRLSILYYIIKLPNARPFKSEFYDLF